MTISNFRKFFTHRLVKAFAWVLGSLGVLSMVLCLGLYLVCSFKGTIVSHLIESQLNRATGLTWFIKGGVEPLFFPRLGIAFHDITSFLPQKNAIKKSTPFITLEKLYVEPDFFSLVLGFPSIKNVTLTSPVITVTENEKYTDSSKSERSEPLRSQLLENFQKTPSNVQKNTSEEKETPTNNSYALSPTLPLSNSSTNSSSLQIASTSEKNILAMNKNGSLIISQDKEVKQLEQSISQGVLSDIKKLILSRDRERIQKFTIQDGSVSLASPIGSKPITITHINAKFVSRVGSKNRFSALVTLPATDLSLDLHGFLHMPKKHEEILVDGELYCNASLMPPKSRAINFEVSSAFQWRNSDDVIELSSLHVQSEGDSAKLIAEINAKKEEVTGHLVVEMLSLPRWFMFARNFPPGLQQPLDHLYGDGDFILTKKSVQVHDLLLNMASSVVKGSVGVRDFTSPVIKVNLDLMNKDASPIDLDYIFPFLAVSDKGVPEPVNPKFTMPYIVPYPGADSDELPDIGYDVQVKSSHVIAHSLLGKLLQVNVFPIEGDVTRIAFSSSSLANGSVTGNIDIDREIVLMHYNLDNVDLSVLPENKGSSVVFSGRATGNTDMNIKVTKGKWANIWGITIDGIINNLKASNPKAGWHLTSKKTKATGNGVVHTLKKDGLKLDGNWNVLTSGIFTSWNPNGDDGIDATLKGVLAWPNEVQKERGLFHISGDLTATGVLVAPLANQLVPVRGKLETPFDWRLDTSVVKLGSFSFNGWQSVINGNLSIDYVNTPITVTSDYVFKMSPQILLKDWNILPDAIKTPEVLTGKGTLLSEGKLTLFDRLVMQMDGGAVTGKVAVETQETEGKRNNKVRALVTSELIADRIDLDKYIVPSTPEELRVRPATTPWNLSFLQGIDLKGKYHLNKVRFLKANFSDADIEVILDNNELSVVSVASEVYGGKGTVNFKGRLDLDKPKITVNKWLTVLKGVSLGRAINDLTNEASYGGTASMVISVEGVLSCSGDLPKALSGEWNLEVQDGIYPAFLGSETAGLRNTFSRALASGDITHGVMNFGKLTLTGSVVDMKGKGWIDFAEKKLDVTLTVALAGVPTVPVRYKGPFSSIEMTSRGSRVVLGAAPIAGASVFYLFKGLLELPARAVRGVGNLFTPEDKVKGTTYNPKTSIKRE